jgi:KDO2-lipid IV(A) lauroyltransferase
MYERFRKQQIQPFIYTHRSRPATTEIIRALRNNEVVFLIADENERSGGVFVNFFNRLASTTPGPAILHLRTGAAIVPIAFYRDHDNTHKIVIDPPLDRPSAGTRRKDIEELTKVITKKIEEHVRGYPSQWMWTHRRWRTRPPGDKAQGIGLGYEQY